MIKTKSLLKFRLREIQKLHAIVLDQCTFLKTYICLHREGTPTHRSDPERVNVGLLVTPGAAVGNDTSDAAHYPIFPHHLTRTRVQMPGPRVRLSPYPRIRRGHHHPPRPEAHGHACPPSRVVGCAPPPHQAVGGTLPPPSICWRTG